MEKNHRLFIRNLPADITNDKLKEIFDEHGTVTNIDIKDKLQKDETRIAFINITTTERQLNTCCQNVNSVVLGNNRISVQIAKESFFDRVKREREEGATNNHSNQTPVFTDRPIERINIKVPVPFVKGSVKKTFSDDVLESIDNETVELVKKITREPPTPSFSNFDNQYDDNNYYKQKAAESFEEKNESFKLKSKEKKVLSESEMKRLASLKKQRQTFKAKEQMVKNALKIVDNNRKNKIIFDDNIGDNDNSNENTRKLSLFNNDDDENENVINFNGDFDETQKRKFKIIGGDKRFKMDERFFDNEDTKPQANEPIEVEDEFTNEKKMQLQILNDVLGVPIARTDEKSIAGKRANRMIRYDPNEDHHRNYEIKNEEEMAVSKKKRKDKNETVIEEPPPIPVSNEVFYSVSNTLSESLKQQEKFSLLKTFGSTIPSDDKNEHYETQDIPKKQGRFEFNFDTKNPFKYDSSDDEEDNSLDRECPPKKLNNELEVENIPVEQCDSFFFIPNDPRFRDAENFFQTKSTSNETFKDVRRELKQIVRSKIRNNARKNQPWKKKIGTKSRPK